MNKIEQLLRTGKNIFSISDLALYWQINQRRKLAENIKYYLRTKKLIPVKRGIYTLNNNYSEFELAQKLIPISYISFYTALAAHGIIFQYYPQIHSVALISKTFLIRDKIYKYHQIKEDIFYYPLGIVKEKNYMIACPERAICDSLYLAPGLSFDNISKIDKDKIRQISSIYKNIRLEKEISRLTNYVG